MKNLLLILFTTSFSIANFAQLCSVFPHPTTYVTTGGSMVLEDLISVNKANLPTFGEDFLKLFFANEVGVNVAFINDGGFINFKRLSNAYPDSYSLDIKDNITIAYSSPASCFYALQTLKQLIKRNNGIAEIPFCFISDEPKFEWRGMHLDVSRHFFTVNEVKQYLDWMARYKFNKFHWHLTDDQGWRIEIKAYPKLTEIGSVREQTLVGHASNSPEKFEGPVEKGYYTQEQIKEIVKYGQKLFIEVVPEIEMPGHARAALAAYPEYSCDGAKLPVAQKWGVFDEIFCSKDETIQFLQNILGEVTELFPGEYIHIGGDEAPKSNWKKCPNCQAQIKKHGLKDEAELQTFFIQQMDDFLTKKGKKIIGWDEILEGGLSTNAAIMSWRGTEGGIEAAKQNHYVVMTPGSHCYFDHYQSDRKSEPLAIGGYTSLEKVYSFNPIPAELPADLRHFILGGQANLWTEYIADWQQVEYMIFPRIIALSEALWCQGERDYTHFKERLEKFELPYLESKNVNYSKAIFYLESEIVPLSDGVDVEFEAADEKSTIEITFDKSAIGVSEKDGIVKIQKTKRPKLVRLLAKSKTILGTDTVGVQILQHRTLGQPWLLDTKPSPSYQGKEGLTLSDGIIGGRPWNGKEWLGFDQKEVKMTIELNAKEKLNGINLSFLQAESSWIHIPEKVVLEYSTNGSRWKSKELKISKEKNRFTIGKKAKFIRLTIVSMEKIPDGQPGSGHAPWMFMDEVYFD